MPSVPTEPLAHTHPSPPVPVLTQDAHVIFALPLVHLDEVVEGV